MWASEVNIVCLCYNILIISDGKMIFLVVPLKQYMISLVIQLQSPLFEYFCLFLCNVLLVKREYAFHPFHYIYIFFSLFPHFMNAFESYVYIFFCFVFLSFILFVIAKVTVCIMYSLKVHIRQS